MIVIVLLARCFNWPCSAGFSTGKTFATLLILTYARMLQISVEVLSFIRVYTVDHGLSTARWLVDPSVEYFSGLHCLLVMVALLLMLGYIIPLPFLLLFPSKAYQVKYIRRLKPIFDAFWNPYRREFRCWLGIRLLVLSCATAVSVYLRFPLNMFVVIVLLIFVNYVQSQIRPYDGVWRNAADTFLIVNMNVIFVGSLFFDHFLNIQSYTHQNTMNHHVKFSTAIVTTAYAVFLAILLYHIYLRLPQTIQQCVMKHIKKNIFLRKLNAISHISEQTVTGNVYYRYEEPDDNTHNIHNSTAFRIHYQPQYSVLESPCDKEGTVDISPCVH